MDKNKALKILGLDSGATRQQARKAYRFLAKNCHPDRFARERAGAEKAEARMKDINGAFHFLLPLLPQGQKPEHHKRDKAANRSGFFSLVREQWKKRSRPKPGPRVSKQGSAGQKSPVYMKRKTGPAAPHFETLLNTLSLDTKSHPLTPPASVKPSRTYENYCRYMAVKKKIKGASNRTTDMGIGRVEKISPVRPVDSVGP